MSQGIEFSMQRLFIPTFVFIQSRSGQQSYDVPQDENRDAHALTDTDNVKVRATQRKGKRIMRGDMESARENLV
jgi:hypothetical protein